MDQQNQFSQNSSPFSPPPQTPKKNYGRFVVEYWKFVIGFLFIMGLALGVYYAWQKYYSPEAKSNQAEEEKWEKAQKALNTLDETLRQDTYGGKTPEETLKMFIDALKKDDIELASKYFALDTNMGSPDYLTRRIWEEGLQKAKDEKRLIAIIDLLSKATFDKKSSYGETAWFIVGNKKGEVEADININLNKQSGVWKIESL